MESANSLIIEDTYFYKFKGMYGSAIYTNKTEVDVTIWKSVFQQLDAMLSSYSRD